MKNKRYQISQYIKFCLKARYFRGHGVHSPFVYDFVRHVLCMADKKPHEYKSWRKTSRQFRRSYKEIAKTLTIDNDLGSKTTTSTTTKHLLRHVAIREKYGLLLTRIVNHYKPDTIIELGTSVGISCFYLWLGTDGNSTITTLEGSKTLCDIAKKQLSKATTNNINIICGDIDTTLPKTLKGIETVNLVFFDANHTKDATLRYYKMCKEKAAIGTIFVFDDIHWSKGMTEAWNEIKKDTDVATTIELYQLGILFFRRGCPKEHYKVLKI